MDPSCLCSFVADSNSIVPLIGAGLGLLFVGSLIFAGWYHHRQERTSRRYQSMHATGRNARQAMNRTSNAFEKQAQQVGHTPRRR